RPGAGGAVAPSPAVAPGWNNGAGFPAGPAWMRPQRPPGHETCCMDSGRPRGRSTLLRRRTIGRYSFSMRFARLLIIC
ncbi:hypothetical protein, partial [Burkholderia glumae]|uniref:hypothetical protein n=1 Tax=Burkholderia glumae TaxID=337 RepID=UPI0019D6FC62